MVMNALQTANNIFEQHIKNNSYPGRGLVVGKMEDNDNFVIVYFIMGRSVNSQNRRFSSENDRLWTEPVDMSKVTDPSLIIYDAMLSTRDVQIVSNGDQTTTIFDVLKVGGTFQSALGTRKREPDAPNFTPRISAIIDFSSSEPAISLSILKANLFKSDLTDRFFYSPATPPAGFGYGLTTYMGDGNPLPSFTGDPLVLPLKGSAEEILDTYWEALNSKNRVSLAVKQTGPTGALKKLLIKNRHK
jgi:hypothetical protein